MKHIECEARSRARERVIYSTTVHLVPVSALVIPIYSNRKSCNIQSLSLSLFYYYQFERISEKYFSETKTKTEWKKKQQQNYRRKAKQTCKQAHTHIRSHFSINPHFCAPCVCRISCGLRYKKEEKNKIILYIYLYVYIGTIYI